MEGHPVPAHQASVETRVANSRFIATAAPAFTTGEARDFIDRVKQEFKDATHNVTAYIIGHGASVVKHCSDDGEPAGTAGPPALTVLEGSGLGDVAVVVTRYFGGTKLGTGGLVRAYGDAVRQVLSALPRAAKVPTHTVRIKMPYGLFEPIRRVVEERQGEVLNEAFAAEVAMTARVPQDALPGLQGALQQLSRGAIRASVVSSSESTIVPIGTRAGQE